MNGDQLKQLRERRGLTRQEFAEILNDALQTKHTADSISRWENGTRTLSRKVSAFCDELALSEFSQITDGLDPAGLDPDDDRPIEGGDGGGDTVPGGPGVPAAQPAIGATGGAYARACEELWELIATGVGMIGAATSNPPLQRDGEIILADKKALGAAWGKLAETNETFRRMLVGMTEGGAWLQVALVTGTTVSKCWQSHQQYAVWVQQVRNGEQQPDAEPVAA